MTEGDTSPEEKTIPFFPDHIWTEAKVVILILVLMIIVGIIGLASPIGLEPPADPMNTPDHVKSDWYFLFLYQLLKYVPKTVGVLIPIFGLILILIWPFIDRKQDTIRARRIRWVIVIVGSIIVIGLTLMGALS
jgi:quinol-cytochrome oxidoreductase complex cytochrome b subunit